jgi:hypothetical protein
MQDDDLDRGIYESHREFREQKYARSIFGRVIKSYRDTRNLSPIPATNPDPSVLVRKLVPDAIHYVVDVENASKKALSPALFLLWQKLVEGEFIPAQYERQIMKRCSKVYADRKLTPGTYFNHTRKGREQKKVEVTV